MTATAGLMLVGQILPIIQAAIARGVVRFTGSEDHEELIQDCLCSAARMVDSAEAAGKNVTPGNVAFYAVQAMKSGRRTGYSGRTDVMSPAAQLDGRVAVVSMDEPVGVDEEDMGDEVTLHACLASPAEDPATAGAREIDWSTVMETLDGRQRKVLVAAAVGEPGEVTAAAMGVTPPRVVQLKREAGEAIREAWGAEVLADVVREPQWKAGMRAWSERRACRYERAVA